MSSAFGTLSIPSASTFSKLLLLLWMFQSACAQAPTVIIPSPAATIIGVSGSVERFSAIPFAEPPVSSLRLKPPQPLTTPLGMITATTSASACPQQSTPTASSSLQISPVFQPANNSAEDCLTLNVYRPQGISSDAKLPVLYWIFGGGFELGSAATYDGSIWVTASLNLKQPIIFVTVNYRVSGFGFLGGKEILADGSANLGLRDQRRGLEWVSDNIAAFGGDPEKVTIWGESAGSISVFNQLVINDGDNTYKGKPLFRAGIMDSGSVVPTDPVDCPKAQHVYDTVVAAAGCSSSSDTLACLRSLDYDTFYNASNSVPSLLGYTSVALSYLPRPDGTFFTVSPDQLGTQGKIARVPVIIGDQEDEGTLFALSQSNITTEADLIDYFLTYYFWHADEQLIQQLVDLYSDTAEYGSPFRTGPLNNLYPEFKRLAAILGDLTFTIVRRASLQVAQGLGIKTWSYLSSYDYGTPVLGTFHGSDIVQVFNGFLPNYAAAAFQAYYISFVNSLDPNNSTNESISYWPQWAEDQQVLNMNSDSSQLIKDDFRQDVLDFLLANEQRFYY